MTNGRFCYFDLKRSDDPSEIHSPSIGIGVGAKIAFDLRGSEVLVIRVQETEHENPAIEAFLALLANDIQSGKTLNGLPADLAQGMFDNLKYPIDLEEEITGNVSL